MWTWTQPLDPRLHVCLRTHACAHSHFWLTEKLHTVLKQIPSVAKLNKYECKASFLKSNKICSVSPPRSVRFSFLALYEASDVLATWVTPAPREDVLSLHPPQLVRSFICVSSALYPGRVACEVLTTFLARGSLWGCAWKTRLTSFGSFSSWQRSL